MNRLAANWMLFMASAKKGRLPSAYKEVEYLEGTGEQWIDTGIVHTLGDTYSLSFIFTEDNYTQRVFGVLTQVNNVGIGLGARNDNNIMVNMGEGWKYPSLTINKDINYSFESDSDYNAILNGNIFYTGKAQSTTTHTISVFATKYNGAVATLAKMKLMSYKHYNSSGTLLRDLVPCYRKSDHKPGMYDLVNNVFYTNQGTEADFLLPGGNL